MDQIRPLVIKFIYIAAISLIFLTFLLVPSVPLLSTLVMAAVITLVLYYIGDRFILPQYGALTASIATFVLAALVISLAGSFIRQSLTAGAVFSTAAVIGVAEWFYYRYVRESPMLKGEILSQPESTDEGGEETDHRPEEHQ